MTGFDAALTGEHCWLIDSAGGRRPLPVLRWRSDPDAADARLLDRCHGPTIDVGCGPGRLAAELTVRGIVTLGVDTSALAVRLTRERGAAALRREVFHRLPGTGRWRHVLLVDGNIGIGGEPRTLLARCAELICRAGSVLVELDPAMTGVRRCLAVVEHATGIGNPFRWASVGVDAAPALASAAGPHQRARWTQAGRAFAELVLDVRTRNSCGCPEGKRSPARPQARRWRRGSGCGSASRSRPASSPAWPPGSRSAH